MKLISAKTVIQRCIDENPQVAMMYKEDTEWLYNRIADAVSIIGNFTQLEDDLIQWDLDQTSSYRVELPCDYVQEIAVLDSRTRALLPHFRGTYQNHKWNNTNNSCAKQMYWNDGMFLNFTRNYGQVEMAYKKLSLDEDGFMKLVDDEFLSQSRAIIAYVNYKCTELNARKGDKESMQMLKYDKEEWNRLCGNAGAYRFMPKTLAEHEAIGNISRQLITNFRQYETNFEGLGFNQNKYI